jgi:uncharacterized small protein (DUF1192 family)
MTQDDASTPPPPRPIDLDLFSIEELEAKIAGLREEIARCQAAIEAKKGHRAAADAVFGASRT